MPDPDDLLAFAGDDAQQLDALAAEDPTERDAALARLDEAEAAAMKAAVLAQEAGALDVPDQPSASDIMEKPAAASELPVGDASPAAAAADQPAEPELRLRGKLTTPEDTNDVYIVLWAYKPRRGERARYEEVGYFEAAGPDQARAKAIEHDGRTKKPIEERGEVARQLIAAAEQRGILLRALPARHWHADCPVTGLVRPDPILTLG